MQQLQILVLFLGQLLNGRLMLYLLDHYLLQSPTVEVDRESGSHYYIPRIVRWHSLINR